MAVPVERYMVGTFRLVPAGETAAAALSRLQAGEFAVVTDGDAIPLTVVTAAELQAVAPDTPLGGVVALPPGVIVGRSYPMLDFVEARLVEHLLIRDGGAVAAAVLGDGTTVVGVLPQDRVGEYLNSDEYEVPPLHMRKGAGTSAAAPGDAVLGGRHQTPAARVRCLTCGHLNTVAYLNPDNPPECANPLAVRHKLKPF